MITRMKRTGGNTWLGNLQYLLMMCISITFHMSSHDWIHVLCGCPSMYTRILASELLSFELFLVFFSIYWITIA
jgi:hypothetical protein